MTDTDVNAPRSGPSRREVTVAVLRALLTASLLIALYYALPLNFEESSISTAAKFTLGAAAFLGLLTWNLRAITQSKNPGLRALEGLMGVVPLFILLFASTYFTMSRNDATAFSAPLSRTDALYFTVTIFSTVGFGDITPKTEAARLVVSAQMILDLIILGLGVRIILEAVNRGRQRISSETTADVAES